MVRHPFCLGVVFIRREPPHTLSTFSILNCAHCTLAAISLSVPGLVPARARCLLYRPVAARRAYQNDILTRAVTP